MRLFFVLYILFFGAGSAIAAPHIIVTLKPIHALISGVTEGVTEPELLLDKQVSLHTYSLTPLDAKKIQKADVVFLVSGHLEAFLSHPLKANHKTKVTVVELLQADGIKRLPIRENNLWGESAIAEKEDKRQPGAYDPYIWLDPVNAIVIVNTARDTLSRQDPENALRYKENAEKMVARIRQMDNELRAKLAPYSDVSYIESFNGYQYFEKHYQLKALGIIANNFAKNNGIGTLNKLQDIITRYNAVCFFTEPQFPSETASHIVEVTGIGIGILDATWGTEEQGTEAYFMLMHNMANSFVGCFDAKRSLMS